MTSPHRSAAPFMPFATLPHPREVIRQFTPNWFAVTMGTGILALCLHALSDSWPLLHGLAEGLWWLNIALFLLCTTLYGLRWVLFTQEARRVFAHGSVSMFLGTIPMGLATLINGLLLFAVPRWGNGLVALAEALWWLDVAMAMVCGVAIPYAMFTRQTHRIEQMTAIWLLPVVAAEVAAVSGGLLVGHLADAEQQLLVVSLSYALWAYSVPVALSIMTILLLRLALHKLPHANMAASSWLTLGPVATAALGMLTLGTQAPTVFMANDLPALASVAQGGGVIVGLLFWGLGLWWLALAVLITLRYFRDEVPFNLGWWGFTFPLGVYTLATLRLGEYLGIDLFHTIGAGLAGCLVLLWLTVTSRTARGAWRGELFVSPCLADDEGKAHNPDK